MKNDKITILLIVLIILFIVFASITYFNLKEFSDNYNSIETTTEVATMENADL